MTLSLVHYAPALCPSRDIPLFQHPLSFSLPHIHNITFVFNPLCLPVRPHNSQYLRLDQRQRQRSKQPTIPTPFQIIALYPTMSFWHSYDLFPYARPFPLMIHSVHIVFPATRRDYADEVTWHPNDALTPALFREYRVVIGYDVAHTEVATATMKRRV